MGTEAASLTAVPGVTAAHWTHDSGTTGVTAVVFADGARGGVAVRGHATGTRELGPLAPTHIAPLVHAFCLSGGSAFGLGAADGVARHLGAQGIGFDTGAGHVPIVPAAVLFDLPGAAVRPGAAEGQAAAAAASSAPLASGRVGAGAGATVGKAAGAPVPGGFGGAARRMGAWTVAAGVAVNAFGSVRDPLGGPWLAGQAPTPTTASPGGDWGGNTTLAVVVTDAPLDKAAAHIVADMAAAGLARTLYPAFTPFDGDVVFVASTGRGAPVDPGTLCALGALAAEVLAAGVVRAVQ